MGAVTRWESDYLGRPWQKGAGGPDAFDCWGLVRAVQRDVYGRELPEVDVDAMDVRAVVRAFCAHPERSRWQRLDVPAQGDCVLLSHARHPSHVGLWLDCNGGGVLHSLRGSGVVFSSLASLRRDRWARIEFYRYIG